MSKLITGRWESPFPSEPYLGIRIAIDIQERAILILHQFVDQSWIHFTRDEDTYLRDLINVELDEIIEDPQSYGLQRSDQIPPAWLYDEAHPGEVNIGCPVASPEPLSDTYFEHRGRRRHHGKRRKYSRE